MASQEAESDILKHDHSFMPIERLVFSRLFTL